MNVYKQKLKISNYQIKYLICVYVMVSLILGCTNTTPPQGKNRLHFEHSPYLKQHAENPVNWYPWGEEAFQKATSENKLVFLSIGYSTCHWCHVMAHESFENESIATYLNKHFVSIKVDREERPDVDRVYMDTVVALTGSGGWPLTVFLTPDRKPIFGGTYFRPSDFKQLLTQITQTWEKDRVKVTEASQQIMSAFEKEISYQKPIKQEEVQYLLKISVDQIQDTFDKTHGGFGNRMKFPQESRLLYLLRLMNLSTLKQTLEPILTHTLDRMLSGGIYDHLEGGLHRYSVDPEWHVPHFEKMLYNQALFGQVLLEAYVITKKQHYLLAATETLNYVLDRLVAKEGGFFSAQDADTEGVEGTTYVWSATELRQTLTPEEFKSFDAHFEFTESGNFEHQTNVLRFKDVTTWKNKTQDPILLSALSKLKIVRNKRSQPGTDTKVITAWNGLMISTLALGYRVTQDKRYLEAAQRSAAFIQKHHAPKNTLMRRSVNTSVKHQGVHSDYAFLIGGLIELYQADSNTQWLEWAKTLQQNQDALLWDDAQGGYFYTSQHKELPFPRTKEYEDGALLSPNGVSTLNLLKLHQLFLDHNMLTRAEKTLGNISDSLKTHPFAFATLSAAALFYWHGGHSIVLVGNSVSLSPWITKLNHSAFPFLVKAFTAEQTLSLPLLKGKVSRQNQPTFYICRDGGCKLPTTDPKVAWDQLNQTGKLPTL
jgi:uncharacterized protein